MALLCPPPPDHFFPTVAGDGTLCVEWSAPSPVTDLALLGNTRTGLARRLVLTAPLGSLDWNEVLLLLPSSTPVVVPSHGPPQWYPL